MILDYSQHVEDRSSSGACLRCGWTEDKRPTIPELFSKHGYCPFCKKPGDVVHHKTDEVVQFPGSGYGDMTIAWQCACGWWQTYIHAWDDETGRSTAGTRTRSAILRRYDPRAIDVPIDVLRREISKSPRAIYEINKRKMEELVGSVFSEHFACEVKFTGQSHDGGIDLYLVLGDTIALVQVKQREFGSRTHKAEPVQSIREFLGAALLNDGRNIIFVTTADHFSPPAMDAARQAVAVDLVSRFDLVNGKEFLHLLKLVQAERPDIWRENLYFR